MQKDKYAKPEPRPNKATDIEITAEWISPNYKLRHSSISEATDTGHLELFRLEPIDDQFPCFSARWDWKPNTVDVDLIGDEEANKAFKAESGGYKGHHTTSDSPRSYQIDIQTPVCSVFRGKIALSVELALYLRDHFSTLVDEVRFRMLANCRHCGIVQFSGPPFDQCPNCHRSLRTGN